MINKRGLYCPNCSERISYPEKMMYCLLRKLNVYFVKEATFEWSEKKRYDFYIPSLNLIIETHGMQHYDGGFHSLGGRTLKQEQANDTFKRKRAITNGILIYVELDCRYSDFEYIKEGVLQSELRDILNLSDLHFQNLEDDIINSLAITVWNLWDSGVKSTSELSNRLNLDEYTINEYLERR